MQYRSERHFLSKGDETKMKMTKKLVAIITIICFTIIAATIQAADLQVRQPTEAEIGRIEVCPVMNSKIAVGKDTPVIDYKGKSYYFCCSSCIDEFKKDPDKFVK
jgi:YHS domain-containing protein